MLDNGNVSNRGNLWLTQCFSQPNVDIASLSLAGWDCLVKNTFNSAVGGIEAEMVDLTYDKCTGMSV